MAREITHDAHGPVYLDEDDLHEEKGDVAVCMCGLSAEYPFCDGSHRATEDEREGVVYRYEGDAADGTRRVIDRVVYEDGAETVYENGRGTADGGDEGDGGTE